VLYIRALVAWLRFLMTGNIFCVPPPMTLSLICCVVKIVAPLGQVNFCCPSLVQSFLFRNPAGPMTVGILLSHYTGSVATSHNYGAVRPRYSHRFHSDCLEMRWLCFLRTTLATSRQAPQQICRTLRIINSSSRRRGGAISKHGSYLWMNTNMVIGPEGP
jgi:hypothetical protein